jgi:hypothetical protein
MVSDSGDTVMDEPVPTGAPPQLLVYHSQLAPVPNEPPDTLSDVVVPGQTEEGEAVAEVGPADAWHPPKHLMFSH